MPSVIWIALLFPRQLVRAQIRMVRRCVVDSPASSVEIVFVRARFHSDEVVSQVRKCDCLSSCSRQCGHILLLCVM
jgi:hypothetical protein